MNSVIVWGNCQAAPLADLLRTPLAAHGLDVLDVPPVYLVTADDLRQIYAHLRNTRVLISQPVSDEYRVPGCGTAQLAGLLPAAARVVRLPVVYDVSAFPCQVRGYDAGGERVDAPVTDYHDLRMVRAAAAGWTAPATVARWAAPSPSAIGAVAAVSRAELRRRETGLDVTVSDLVGRPNDMWTMTHPTNRVLAALARRVLDALGCEGDVTVPRREYLGQRRAPVDADVAAALHRPASARADWIVDGAPVPLRALAKAQLDWYAARPDVVTATLARATPRLRLLGP